MSFFHLDKIKTMECVVDERRRRNSNGIYFYI